MAPLDILQCYVAVAVVVFLPPRRVRRLFLLVSSSERDDVGEERGTRGFRSTLGLCMRGTKTPERESVHPPTSEVMHSLREEEE